MSDQNKFWLAVIGVICLTFFMTMLVALGGCREVEKTNQTALQNGYQMDRGDWRKHQ